MTVFLVVWVCCCSDTTTFFSFQPCGTFLPSIAIIFCPAGGYLLRNTPFTLQFLQAWANYEFDAPAAFHSSDNGALHLVLLDALMLRGRQDCFHLFANLTDSADSDVISDGELYPYYDFVACSRKLLGYVCLFSTLCFYFSEQLYIRASLELTSSSCFVFLFVLCIAFIIALIGLRVAMIFTIHFPTLLLRTATALTSSSSSGRRSGSRRRR